MNSREQFLKTINHRQPDRIVLDLGSTTVTGIHVQTISRLRRHFGLQRKPIRVIEPYQMLGEVGWELIDSIGIDVIGAWNKNNLFGFHNYSPYKEWKTPWGQRVMVPMKFNVSKGEVGDILMHPEGDTSLPPSAGMPKDSYRFEPIDRQNPLIEENLNVDDNLEEFGILTEKEMEHWKTEIDKAYFSGKAVIAAFNGTALGDITQIHGMNLSHPKGIRNKTEWFTSTITRPSFIKKIFDKQTEIALENLHRLYSVVGNKLTAIFICGTDTGYDNSTYCSAEQFNELWFPYYKRMNDWIHQNTQWKTFKRSCGAIEPFLSDYMRAGFDIINPVHINDTSMDARQLKEKYGHNLVFWGGGIDSPKGLPFESPADLRERTLRTCEIFNNNGGFVFSPENNIKADMPVENIVAMLEAIKEFNGR